MDDPELLALLRRLLSFEADGAARPDRDVGLVLADWLKEHSDPRGRRPGDGGTPAGAG